MGLRAFADVNVAPFDSASFDTGELARELRGTARSVRNRLASSALGPALNEALRRVRTG